MAKATKKKEDNRDPSVLKPKKAKARRPRKSTRRHAAVSEYSSSESDEDSGRLESQEFLAMTKAMARQKAAKPIDGHAIRFQAIVEQHKQILIGHLNKKADTVVAQRIKSKNALMSMLLGSLQYTFPRGLQNREGKTNPTIESKRHPVHQKTTILLGLSKDLINTYDTISEEIVANEECLWLGQEWEHDCQQLHNLLDVGERATIGQVKELLFESPGLRGVAISKDTSPKNARKAWNSFGMLQTGDTQDTRRAEGVRWAKVAEDTVKGIRRATKHLPRNLR